MHLTPPELAARLKVNITTLAIWRVRGTGPKFMKVGRRVRYPLSEIEKWEKEQLRKNTSV